MVAAAGGMRAHGQRTDRRLDHQHRGGHRRSRAVPAMAARRREALLNNPFDLAFDASGQSDFLRYVQSLHPARSMRGPSVISHDCRHRRTRLCRRRRTGDAGDAEPAVRRGGGPGRHDLFRRPVEPPRAAHGSRRRHHHHAGGRRLGQIQRRRRAGGCGRTRRTERPGAGCDGRRLFIADVADHRVRVVDLATGIITTFAGTGEARHDGDGGPATRAGIFGARAVAFAPDGALYVMERQGSCMRRVRDGIIETVAGTGARGYAGDGGDARAGGVRRTEGNGGRRRRQHLHRRYRKPCDPLIDARNLDRHAPSPATAPPVPAATAGRRTQAGLARPHGATSARTARSISATARTIASAS